MERHFILLEGKSGASHIRMRKQRADRGNVLMIRIGWRLVQSNVFAGVVNSIFTGLSSRFCVNIVSTFNNNIVRSHYCSI